MLQQRLTGPRKLVANEAQPQEPRAHLVLGIAHVAGLHPRFPRAGGHGADLHQQAGTGFDGRDRKGIQRKAECQIPVYDQLDFLPKPQRHLHKLAPCVQNGVSVHHHLHVALLRYKVERQLAVRSKPSPAKCLQRLQHAGHGVQREVLRENVLSAYTPVAYIIPSPVIETASPVAGVKRFYVHGQTKRPCDLPLRIRLAKPRTSDASRRIELANALQLCAFPFLSHSFILFPFPIECSSISGRVGRRSDDSHSIPFFPDNSRVRLVRRSGGLSITQNGAFIKPFVAMERITNR